MKRKTVIFIVMAAIIIILIVMCISMFTPKRIINTSDYVVGLKVIYKNHEVPVNSDDVIEILSKFNAVTSLKDYFPYESKRINFEINFVCNHKPVHILLGEFNVWYGSTDRFAHDILDAEKLKSELKTALNIE